MKPKERQVSIQVGWCNYSFRDQRYKLVKLTKDKQNSGPRIIKFDRSSTISSVERTLKNIFFPQEKSPFGSQKNFSFYVGTFRGECIDPSVTVDDYISSHVKPRLYLHSKLVSFLCNWCKLLQKLFWKCSIPYHCKSNQQYQAWFKFLNLQHVFLSGIQQTEDNTKQFQQQWHQPLLVIWMM